MSWFTIPYDPFSGQTVFYTSPSYYSGIYSTHLMFYDSATQTFTDWGGTSSTNDMCPADLPNQPGDRHPVGMVTVDTKRGFLWISGGPNQTCGIAAVNVSGQSVTWTGPWNGSSPWHFATNGQLTSQSVYVGGTYTSVTSVQDSQHLTIAANLGTLTNVELAMMSGTESSPRQDMYYMTLNPNPLTNTWTQVTPTSFPFATHFSSMVYDSDDDLIFAFGYDYGPDTHDNWIYCSTIGNPGGALTPTQTAAGCSKANTWIEVCPSSNLTCSSSAQPPGTAFPGLVYDAATQKVFQFGGESGGTRYNQVWAYDVPSHTWTQKSSAGAPPPTTSAVYWGMPAIAYNPNTHTVLFHQFDNAGAPADYQYFPLTDSWAPMTSTAGGGGGMASCSVCAEVMAYDSRNDRVIVYSAGGGLWQGKLGP
jgi:hypothetical protein